MPFLPCSLTQYMAASAAFNNSAADGLSVRQTVSIGVATLEADKPRTADELMRAADMAMYRVKAAGKDGIYVAQEGS